MQTHATENVADHNKTARQSTRGGLPDQLRAGIEHLSGMAMDDVAVHYNSARPARLEALAFAQGTDIHLAPGQERHLPHEAWHVVQQKQGRVAATLQAKGVDINADPALEAEADRMGAQAQAVVGTQGARAARWQPKTQMAVSQLRPVVQRLGERPIKDGYAGLTSHASWMDKAKAYEQSLGVYAYDHRLAESALDTGLGRMKEVIDAYYMEVILEDDEKEDLYRDVFTKDDASSAGQIGKTAVKAEIDTMLTSGNLRERMTAFYNAAYFNSSSEATPLRGLKQILDDILFRQQQDLVKFLGLDAESLKKQTRFLKDSKLRTAAYYMSKPMGKEYNFADDPFALGSLTLDDSVSGTIEMGMSQRERVARTDVEKEAEKRSAADYEDLDLDLSAREKAFTARHMGKQPDDADYSTSKLPWLEGHSWYKMQKDSLLGQSWVEDIHERLRMPIVAGVSGTTTRMLTAYKWLGCANPENFRLALMGWMLPARDHSLYEIMRGSHLAGVKPAEDSDLTDVIDMYMKIAPLPPDELRVRVAKNRQFPHEQVYMERIQAEDSTDASSFIGTYEDGKDEAVAKYNAYRGDKSNFSAAHATAIYNYTSGIHSLMNAALSMPAMLAKKVIRDKLVENACHGCRLIWLRANHATLSKDEAAELKTLEDKKMEKIDALDKGDNLDTWMTTCSGFTTRAEVEPYIQETVLPWIDGIIDPLYEEMKIHANMTTEALHALPAATGFDVWRGDWSGIIGSRYEKGSVYTHDTLTSYSRREKIARKFAKSGTFSTKALIKLQLSGKGGRDISKFSAYKDEKEVLMLPGSKVRITNVSLATDPTLGEVKLCDAEEV